jgi:MFS family permease
MAPALFSRVFYGWWIVAAGGLIVLVANGTLWYGFSLLFDPIVNEFGWSTMATAAAFSLRSEVSAFGAPITGWLADRMGARRTMMLGVYVTVWGFVAFSQVNSLLTFYLSFALIAVAATATGNQVAMVAVSWWFIRKRSRALAGLTVGAGLSGITVPLFAMLVNGAGWRTALLLWALIITVVCIPVCLIIRDKPEHYGLLPDGDRPAPVAVSAAATGGRPRVVVHRAPSLTVRQALHSRTFWYLGAAMLLQGLGSNPAVALLVPALSKVGIEPAHSALAIAAVPIISLPGRVAAGWLGDTHDKRVLMAGCLALQGAGVLMLAATTTPWMLVLAIALFAPPFGGLIPLRPALQAEAFGVQSIGTIQGLMNTVATFGGFVGPLLVGALVDLTDSYQLGFAIVGVATLAGIPFALAIPRGSAPVAAAEPAPAG